MPKKTRQSRNTTLAHRARWKQALHCQ